MFVLYLHGFASSAGSYKARFFAGRFAARGVEFACPDLNEPDFSRLTATRMIDQAERLIHARDPRSVVLIGSSLGAFVAWHVAARAEAAGRPPGHLVLLAPAFDFGGNRMRELGGVGVAKWADTGWLEVFHNAYGEPRRVHYDLCRDAAWYRSGEVAVSSATLVFQGRHDGVVDALAVEEFAASRPNIDLRLLNDDHQLHGSLGQIWSETAQFLGLDP